jgi:iron(III)-enterobactin esterase
MENNMLKLTRSGYSKLAVLLIAAIAAGCSSPGGGSGGSGGGGPSPSGGTGGNGATTPTGPGTGSGGAPTGTGGATSTGGAPGTGGRPDAGTTTGSTGGRGVDAGGAGAVTGGAGAGATDPGTVGDGDFMVGPTYTPSPDLRLKPGAPAGFTVRFTMNSAMSTVFDGSDFNPPLSFTRSIQVFVPQQYVDGTASPFMVSSDGFYAGLQTVVQNLADDPSPDHHVPPLVIIGIQNGPNPTGGPSERSLEYDTVSDRYWQFVTKEVIPAILANAQLRARFPNFKLTSDPNGRGGYGCSSGGPAVMGLAWFGDFNRVLSFSGSFTALHPTPDHPLGAWEYPTLIMNAPARPDLRVFLEVGQNDNNSTDAESTHRNWVIANRAMAAALKAKGNHYRFIFAQGAGHCDNNPRNQVMPEGLIWLWRGYQAK